MFLLNIHASCIVLASLPKLSKERYDKENQRIEQLRLCNQYVMLIAPWSLPGVPLGKRVRIVQRRDVGQLLPQAR